MRKQITVNPNTGAVTKTVEKQPVEDRSAAIAAIIAFVIFVGVLGSLGVWAIVEIWQRILSAL